MKLRFIEFKNEIYIVLGISFDPISFCECFVAVPLSNSDSLYKQVLSLETINIPLAEAVEITDKKQIAILMVLYG